MGFFISSLANYVNVKIHINSFSKKSKITSISSFAKHMCFESYPSSINIKNKIERECFIELRLTI